MLKSYKVTKGKSLNKNHPWRCLCRGFLQITCTTFLRFTILQLAQSLFTDGRTFIIREMGNSEGPPRCHFWRYVIRPFHKSHAQLSSITLSPATILIQSTL